MKVLRRDFRISACLAESEFVVQAVYSAFSWAETAVFQKRQKTFHRNNESIFETESAKNIIRISIMAITGVNVTRMVLPVEKL